MKEAFDVAAEALESAGVRFVLGGGFAVNVHGYERGTRDVDLLISSNDSAQSRESLAAAGFQVLRSEDVVTRYSPPAGMKILLDTLPLDPGTFEQLWGAALIRPFSGRNVRVLSLEHLLAMKIHAMRSDGLTRGLKDLLDIVEVARANHLDAESAVLRELCLRFGDDTILKSIKDALAGS